MSRFVLCNRYVFPDHSATAQLVSDLAFALANAGHEVVLMGSRQAYDDPSVLYRPLENVRGVDIRRVGGSRFGRGSLIGRSVDYLTFFAGAALALMRHVRRGDVVVLKTDPPLQSVVLGPVSRLRGARVVNWLQDLFPEVAEQLLGGVVSGWRARRVRTLRDRSLRRASANVVLGARMADRVSAVVGADRRAPVVIPNWVDDRAIVPLPRPENRLRQEWGLGSAFIVGYSGNLGRAHDASTVLEAATRLRTRADIRFLFVGGGHASEELQRQVRDRGLENVVFQPYQLQDGLCESLSVPDVHWISLRPELEGLIVPSKLYGALAAGRPVIFVGDTDGEVARAIERGDCGMTIAQGDGAGFATAVEWLAADPARVAAMGTRARALLDAEFSREAALRSWIDLLTSVSGATESSGRGHGPLLQKQGGGVDDA